jgi:hypothetical protein
MGIHHVSIPASDPEHVAAVLAEVFGTGQVVPFPEHAGSFMALALDEAGTFVEVYPASTVLRPGEQEEQPVRFDRSTAADAHAFHVNLSVPTSEQDILRIAKREGWRAVRAWRHINHVVELWVENRLMIELMPPEFAKEYLAFMHPEHLARVAAAERAAAS